MRRNGVSASIAASYSRTNAPSEVASTLSAPAIMDRRRAQSRARRASGPTTSSEKRHRHHAVAHTARTTFCAEVQSAPLFPAIHSIEIAEHSPSRSPPNLPRGDDPSQPYGLRSTTCCCNAMHYARRSGDQNALRACDMAHPGVSAIVPTTLHRGALEPRWFHFAAQGRHPQLPHSQDGDLRWSAVACLHVPLNG
jgi:hypothetical protein